MYDSNQSEFALGHDFDGQRKEDHARGWWSQVKKQNRIEDSDRVNFEARSRPNLTNSTACRRLVAIAEAYEVASRPDWTLAMYFSDPRAITAVHPATSA